MTDTVRAAAVSGRATGVLFFSGFGSIWLYNGLAAMHRINLISGLAIAAIFGSLFLPALRLLRTASKVVPGPSPEDAEIKRVFHKVNAIQWLSITVSVVLLNLIHKPEFLTPVIAFIVGMHLFPLAKVFRYPAHNVTGTLLVVWATAVVAMLPGAMLPPVCGVGTAVILLGSAAYTLTAANRVAKRVLPLTTASRMAA